MRNILFFIALSAIMLSGCVPLASDNGWSATGYNYTTDTLKVEIGSVSTRLMYENATTEFPDRDFDRDLSNSGFMFGVYIEKKF